MRFCQAKHARGRESGHVRKPGSTKEDALPAPSKHILGMTTTLLSSEEASLCHKEAGTHFDKRTVLTMFRALTKVNN